MTTRADGDRVALLAIGALFLENVYGLSRAPSPGHETWTGAFGTTVGGAANHAIAAARLGASAALESWVGDDDLSHLSLARLAAEGVDTTDCTTLSGWRLPVTASLSYDGDRAMVTGGTPAPPLRASTRSAATAIADLDCVDGSWFAAASAAGTAVTGTIGWDDDGRWDPAALAPLRWCTVFQPNLVEALAFARTDDVHRAARVLGEHVPLVVVTLGAGGVLALDTATGEEVRRPGVRAEAVDPTGAGDVFGAAFALGGIAGWSLVERLDLASLVAAITVSRTGGAASAPRRDELLPWLAAHPDAAEPGRFDFLVRALAPGMPDPFLPASTLTPRGHSL